MYLNYYGMQKEPFQITPDPSYLYLSPAHKEALASIIYGIKNRVGIISIIGDVGTGKTTIVRKYLELMEKNTKCVYVYNPDICFSDLLRILVEELNLEITSENESQIIRELHKYLIEEYTKGHYVVVIIDEAQNLPIDTMEKLRQITNIETNTSKLLQIVLVGQRNLEDKLLLKSLEQLNQRIVIKAYLAPLKYDESLQYIDHRLKRVSDNKIFTKSAKRKIIRYSKGIPRRINVLCSNALIAGFGGEKKIIDGSLIDKIISERNEKKHISIVRYLLPFTIAASIMASIGIYVYVPLNVDGRVTHDTVSNQEAMRAVVYMEPDRSFHGKSNEIANRYLESIQRNKRYENDKVNKGRYPVKRFITEGDSLLKLVSMEYGYINNGIVALVKRKNNIDNENLIRIGEEIEFPMPL